MYLPNKSYINPNNFIQVYNHNTKEFSISIQETFDQLSFRRIGEEVIKNQKKKSTRGTYQVTMGYTSVNYDGPHPTIQPGVNMPGYSQQSKAKLFWSKWKFYQLFYCKQHWLMFSMMRKEIRYFHTGFQLFWRSCINKKQSRGLLSSSFK